MREMWNKSEIWNKKGFRILLCAELLLILAVLIGLIPGDRIVGNLDSYEVMQNAGEYDAEEGIYEIDEEDAFSGDFLEVTTGKLTPGVYRLEVFANTQSVRTNSFRIEGTSGKYNEILSNAVVIFENQEKSTCQFYVLYPVDEAKIYVSYGGSGTLPLADISVVKTNGGCRILLTLFLVGFFLLDFLVVFHDYLRKYPVALEKKLVWFGIPAIAIIASYPIFVDYIAAGADASFHIMRIEFLAKAIARGDLPTRVEADWIGGHGYANSIFYCDTFLVFPALLRLIGFTMTFSYNTYILAVNLATAIIAYLCFKGMFEDWRIGMVGSVIWTLSPYHVYNFYNRSAVGEFTALTFLPMVVYGFFRIFTQDTQEKGYRRNWLILVLGFSGIIQSHALSCEMTAAFCAILCLIFIKRVFRKRTFLELLKAVLGTLALNAWFLVPFVDMTLSGEYNFSGNSEVEVQSRGVLLANIFSTMQSAGENSKFVELGLIGMEPIDVGVALLFGVVVWLIARKVWKDGVPRVYGRTALAAFVIGIIGLFLSSAAFPYDAIQDWNPTLGGIISMIQFPTRLTSFPTICFCVVTCTATLYIFRNGCKLVVRGFLILLLGSSVLFSLYQTNDYLLTKDSTLRVYSMENMGNGALLGSEYLLQGADFPFLFHAPEVSEGVTIASYGKENLTMTFDALVDGASTENYVDLPVLAYKGYAAVDLETGEKFELSANDAQDLRILLPAGYEGTIRVSYDGMWYWHLAEGASLLALLFVIALQVRAHLK